MQKEYLKLYVLDIVKGERMVKDIRFEQLDKNGKVLLLETYDYTVDSEGYVLNPSGSKIQSKEIPSKFLKLDDVVLTPGSLEVIEASPTSVSKFIREKMEDYSFP